MSIETGSRLVFKGGCYMNSAFMKMGRMIKKRSFGAASDYF